MCAIVISEYSIAILSHWNHSESETAISTKSRSIYTLPFITSYLTLANQSRLSCFVSSLKLHIILFVIYASKQVFFECLNVFNSRELNRIDFTATASDSIGQMMNEILIKYSSFFVTSSVFVCFFFFVCLCFQWAFIKVWIFDCAHSTAQLFNVFLICSSFSIWLWSGLSWLFN